MTKNHPRQPPLPLKHLPRQFVEYGLREANTYPLVGHRLDNGQFRAWRLPAEKAWRAEPPFDEIEWPRTGTSFTALVLDCDTRRSIEFAHACAMNAQPLPTPNVTLIRRGRGTLHASWFLARPVLRGRGAREAPLRWFARISEYYRLTLEADAGYVGVLSHNPLSEAYESSWLRCEPYTLGELARAIPLQWRRPPKPTTAAGRNSALFEALIREAGREVLDDTVIAHLGEYLNGQFDVPLPEGEVDDIIRSILRNYRPRWRAGGWHSPRFKGRQRARGRRARNQVAAGPSVGSGAAGAERRPRRTHPRPARRRQEHARGRRDRGDQPAASCADSRSGKAISERPTQMISYLASSASGMPVGRVGGACAVQSGVGNAPPRRNKLARTARAFSMPLARSIGRAAPGPSGRSRGRPSTGSGQQRTESTAPGGRCRHRGASAGPKAERGGGGGKPRRRVGWHVVKHTRMRDERPTHDPPGGQKVKVVRERPIRPPQSLVACTACGRTWLARRRKTCPGCGGRETAPVGERAATAADIERQHPAPAPGEDLRRLVKACAGDWEWARRLLERAGGDVARATAAARTTGRSRR